MSYLEPLRPMQLAARIREARALPAPGGPQDSSFPRPSVPGEVVSYLEMATLASSPSWARSETRTVLGAWQVWQETIDTAELLVSELVTNAVKFANPKPCLPEDSSPDGSKHISLILRYLADRLVIEVADPNPAPPAVADTGDDEEGGRGLMLVQALSKDWNFYLPPSGGKVVYCVLAT